MVAQRLHVFLFLLIACWTTTTTPSFSVADAFSVVTTTRTTHYQQARLLNQDPRRDPLLVDSWSSWALRAAAAESDGPDVGGDGETNLADEFNQAAEQPEAAAADAAVGDDDDVDAEPQEEEPEEEEPDEDPELTALKAEIESLEIELKTKRRKVADVSDKADDFTKTGYARKVAEMENMRRARSMLASSNRFSATAAVLTEFLPVYDHLMHLRTKYESDEFGKQYSALPGAMRNAFFGDLGVTEYEINVGDVVDTTRMAVIESEHSADNDKDTVLRPLTAGLELQGNIIRMAECVASLGAEPTEEEIAEQTPDESKQEYDNTE